MKIRILKPVLIDKVNRVPGEVLDLEVTGDKKQFLVSNHIAEWYEEPKRTKDKK